MSFVVQVKLEGLNIEIRESSKRLATRDFLSLELMALSAAGFSPYVYVCERPAKFVLYFTGCAGRFLEESER